MEPKKVKRTLDIDAETRIKNAARNVFHRKGFNATRTRDIAQEADMNLALLNYYFKSKENLFHLIMMETITQFTQNMAVMFNEERTTLEEKIQLVTEKYIDLIMSEPEIPVFIMSEIRNNAKELIEKLPIGNAVLNSVFIKQYKIAVQKGKVLEPHPLHFLMNLLSMIVFPFLSSPMVRKVGNISDRQFDKLMKERKKLIPLWVMAILKVR